MFLETLILGICVQGHGGCSESTSAYYQHNKDVQQVVKNVEEYGKKMVNGNEWIVYAATPFYAFVSGKPATFTIARGWALEVNVKEQAAAIKWTY